MTEKKVTGDWLTTYLRDRGTRLNGWKLNIWINSGYIEHIKIRAIIITESIYQRI